MENARSWLNIIRYGESGTVMQIQDDCMYRVLDIINNRKILKQVLGPYYKKYILAYLQIDELDLNKIINNTLIQICLERKILTLQKLKKNSNEKILKIITDYGYEVGLFISHVSSLIRNNNFQPLIDLEFLVRSNSNLSVIVFSEIDLSHAKYDFLVHRASFLFDHLIKYPLYGEKDIRQFIRYYCHQWNFSLPERKINEMILSCGGYLWLNHQAVRNLRDDRNISVMEALTGELMIRKLESLWSKFTDQEKIILRKIIFGSLLNPDTLTHEYQYLKDIQVIKENKGQVKLGIPLFSLVVEKENKMNEVQVKGNQILIGERDITDELSKTEKSVMSLLLNNKRKIVSRDKISRVVWGETWEEKYSDWAIDRLIHRIRKKLNKLCIDEKLLKTIKKKGFIFG